MANEQWQEAKVILEHEYVEIPARFVIDKARGVLINVNLVGREGYPQLWQSITLIHNDRSLELQIISEDTARRIRNDPYGRDFYLYCGPRQG